MNLWLVDWSGRRRLQRE